MPKGNMKKCEICGNSFAPYRRKNKYCSDACRKEAGQRRRVLLYRHAKYGDEKNHCNICGKVIPKNKRLCDDCNTNVTICIVCGKKRRYNNAGRKKICMSCNHKLRQVNTLLNLLAAPELLEFFLKKLLQLQTRHNQMMKAMEISIEQLKESLQFFQEKN